MNSTERALSGLGVFLILIGIYAWYDHGRSLECRQGAQSKGVSVVEAVKLCRR